MGNIETTAKKLWLQIRSNLAEMWQRFRNRLEFRSHALKAASDGRITAAERKQLTAFSETLPNVNYTSPNNDNYISPLG